MKTKDRNQINQNYDNIINDLEKTATTIQTLMPLAAQSLRLTIEILKVYKEAFNVTAEKNK